MTEAVRNEIVRLSEQGLSGRRIAQQLRVSRHTVAAALQQVVTARQQGVSAVQPPPRLRCRRSLKAFESVIEQLLERYPDLTC
jgi:IS30 family transposase